MTAGRAALIAAQLAATYLFISTVSVSSSLTWWGWAAPLALLILIIVNSIWFTRFSSWLIFSGAFFSLLVVLSAFTIRWRLDDKFSSAPFYKAMGMYTCMVYASLGQIKMNARRLDVEPH